MDITVLTMWPPLGLSDGIEDLDTVLTGINNLKRRGLRLQDVDCVLNQ